MDNKLTFAEALRLCGKRGAVESRKVGAECWEEFFIDQPHGPHVNMSLAVVASFAESEFRRVTPRKSRVQEMADAHAVSFEPAARHEQFAERIIAEVCQFVRDEYPGVFIAGQIASSIQRRFLWPH